MCLGLTDWSVLTNFWFSSASSFEDNDFVSSFSCPRPFLPSTSFRSLKAAQTSSVFWATASTDVFGHLIPTPDKEGQVENLTCQEQRAACVIEFKFWWRDWRRWGMRFLRLGSRDTSGWHYLTPNTRMCPWRLCVPHPRRHHRGRPLLQIRWVWRLSCTLNS